jgi:hypothetical protein
MSIVVVTGGRKYADRERLRTVLDQNLERIKAVANEKLAVMGKELLLVHGNGTGADALADEWARDRDVVQMIFPAKWKELGRMAGPMRNEAMIRTVTIMSQEMKTSAMVLAFPTPGSENKGTHGTMRMAAARGLPVIDATKGDDRA